jgi:hypothetical protein
MTRLYPRYALREQGHTLHEIGLDETLPPIRRSADGHIDYDYYLRRAKRERAKAFRRLAPAAVAVFAKIVPGRELVRKTARHRS